MFRKRIGIFLKPLECFPVNVIIKRDNESILFKQWNVNGRGPEHLSVSYPADKNFGTGDGSGARCNLRLEIDFKFLMLKCRMRLSNNRICVNNASLDKRSISAILIKTSEKMRVVNKVSELAASSSYTIFRISFPRG